MCLSNGGPFAGAGSEAGFRPIADVQVVNFGRTETVYTRR